MKTLTKIISAALVLATAASASNLNFNNLTKNLSVGVEKGLMDKQHITAVNVSKSFFDYATLNIDISNKTYKDYSLSLNLYSIPIQNNGKIAISGIYGYETFNARYTQTLTQQNQDQEITTKKDIDTKKHQIYLGLSGTYIVTKNLSLYNEFDLGTRTATLKLGMQHYFTNHVSVGAEISKRWHIDSTKYDDTNNILFNVSYTF